MAFFAFHSAREFCCIVFFCIKVLGLNYLLGFHYLIHLYCALVFFGMQMAFHVILVAFGVLARLVKRLVCGNYCKDVRYLKEE